MKKSFLILALLALVVPGCNDATSDSTPPLPPPTIVDPNGEQASGALADGDIVKILHVNDTHGAIEYLEGEEPGMARIAGYVEAKRAEADTDVVLVSSGDMFQGSLDSNISKGHLMIDIMKEMRFDSMSIGNHEFDWGVQTLEQNAAYAMDGEGEKWAFPFLSGNILDPEGQYDLGYLSTTFNRGGARISIIGSIDAGVYGSIDAALVDGYQFASATTMVANEAMRLREQGSDIIIYSTHDADRQVPSAIANYVDAVFTGHSHYYSVEAMTTSDERTVPVIESSSNGRMIGEVDFIYDTDTDRFSLASYGNTNPLDVEPLTPDEGVQAIYDSYLDAPCQDGIVVADSLRALKYGKIGEINSASRFVVSDRISEANVRTMFTIAQLNAYQESDGAIASAYNESRSGWDAGDITYSDVYRAFPFDNATIIVELTGAQLKRWSTYTYYAAGYSKLTLDNATMYKVVTSTYVINNQEMYNYTSIVKTDAGIFQRHVLYQAFVDAGGAPNPFDD